MEAGGISSANVANSAAGQIYNTMLQQARTLAYVDTVHVLVVMHRLPDSDWLPDEEASFPG